MNIKTPEGQLSFPRLLKPEAGLNGKSEYKTTILWPSGTDLSELKQAAAEVAEQKWGPRSQWPKGLRSPFRDGNEKRHIDGYADTTFLTAKCDADRCRPLVVQPHDPSIEVTDPMEIYGGRWARLLVRPYAYHHPQGGPGVSFALVAVQLLRHDTPLGGGVGPVDPTEHFQPVKVENVGPVDLESDPDRPPW